MLPDRGGLNYGMLYISDICILYDIQNVICMHMAYVKHEILNVLTIVCLLESCPVIMISCELHTFRDAFYRIDILLLIVRIQHIYLLFHPYIHQYVSMCICMCFYFISWFHR